jgi:hypothetical protein
MSRAPDLQALAEPSVRQQVVALMKDERHEEALAILYRARSTDPDNPELRRSIDHLKAYLIGGYATRLGGLDRVVPPLPEAATRTANTLLLARYIDGSTTFGDVAELHPLGQLRTLQLLVKLYGIERQAVSGTTLAFSDQPAISSSTRTRADQEESAPVTARSGSVAPYSSAPSSAAPYTYSSAPPSSAAPYSSAPPSSSAPSRGLGTTAFDDPKSEQARLYKEQFERGTSAFVQERYEDAVDAFGSCVELRSGDPLASVMLRRSLRGLARQVP